MLWHYTDAAGVVGILDNEVDKYARSAKFWATGVEYLNDHKELVYGLEFLRGVIRAYADDIAAIEYADDEPHFIVNVKDKVKFLSGLCAATERVIARDYPTFIYCFSTSFSTEGDQLSQWRAYGSGTNGFAIAIEPVKAPTAPGHPLRPGPSLVPVHYGHDTVPDLLGKAVSDRLQNAFMFRTEAPATTDGMFDQQLRWIASFAAQIKHHGFREEREWRYIDPGYFDGASYRSSGSRLVPYVEWWLPPDAVIGVKVGPGPNQRENARAIEGLLWRRNYNIAARNVTLSETPFR